MFLRGAYKEGSSWKNAFSPLLSFKLLSFSQEKKYFSFFRKWNSCTWHCHMTKDNTPHEFFCWTGWKHCFSLCSFLTLSINIWHNLVSQTLPEILFWLLLQQVRKALGNTPGNLSYYVSPQQCKYEAAPDLNQYGCQTTNKKRLQLLTTAQTHRVPHLTWSLPPVCITSYHQHKEWLITITAPATITAGATPQTWSGWWYVIIVLRSC